MLFVVLGIVLMLLLIMIVLATVALDLEECRGADPSQLIDDVVRGVVLRSLLRRARR